MALETVKNFHVKDESFVGRTFAGSPIELSRTLQDKDTNVVMLKAGIYQITFEENRKLGPQEAKATVKWWSLGASREEIPHTAEYTIDVASGHIKGSYSQLGSTAEKLKAFNFAHDVRDLYNSEPVQKLFAGLEDRKKSLPHIQP